jgi:hypothetical protein
MQRALDLSHVTSQQLQQAQRRLNDAAAAAAAAETEAAARAVAAAAAKQTAQEERDGMKKAAAVHGLHVTRLMQQQLQLFKQIDEKKRRELVMFRCMYISPQQCMPIPPKA